jgi:hypothetical protein
MNTFARTLLAGGEDRVDDGLLSVGVSEPVLDEAEIRATAIECLSTSKCRLLSAIGCRV